MSNSVKNILAKVGGTPLVEISGKLNKGGAKVLAKVEYFNPGGSVKDRIALSMVEAAEKSGVLRQLLKHLSGLFSLNFQKLYFHLNQDILQINLQVISL